MKLNLGTYAEIKQNGKILEKKISFLRLNEVQKEVLKSIYNGKEDIETFQKMLKKIKFPFARVFRVKEERNGVSMHQKLINGDNVDEVLSREFENENFEFERVFAIYSDVLKLWKISHSQNRCYVDFNLRNFVYKKKKLFLVDLFPPLISKNIKDVVTPGAKNQILLWTSPYINLTSLICYLLQPLILSKNYSKKNVNIALDYIFSILQKCLKIEKDVFISSLINCEHVFVKRFFNLLKIADGDNDCYEFLNAKLF